MSESLVKIKCLIEYKDVAVPIIVIPEHTFVNNDLIDIYRSLFLANYVCEIGPCSSPPRPN